MSFCNLETKVFRFLKVQIPFSFRFLLLNDFACILAMGKSPVLVLIQSLLDQLKFEKQKKKKKKKKIYLSKLCKDIKKKNLFLKKTLYVL